MADTRGKQSSQRRGFLFGRNITKSLSPLLHGTVFAELDLDWSYERVDTDDIDLVLRCLQDENLYGAAVTMPHKVAIMKHLDVLTEICRDVGACNTIFVTMEEGRRILCGTNTDVLGVKEAFYRNVSEPHKTFEDRPVMVIGSGGAARSAVYAAQKWMRATQIYLVNRDDLETQSLLAECEAAANGSILQHINNLNQADDLPTPGAIISCIPDFAPQTHGEKLVRDIMQVFLRRSDKGAILDMCYNPTPNTAISRIAKQEGWQVIAGTEMLIWQGLEQDTYWTGRPIEELPVQQVKTAIANRLALNLQTVVNE
ncbi:Quinate dehydrogenase [Pestalotiopsis fici W106-1]|uniref:Quinate dehydrogenase n=1 Tax=Pestalotiopsis fici (strain W106-1 / CGMCC3.15140) TaxID=1229662 RepID=W3XIL6_PESFW|nr:Quinate dehydrogenase [Pestalotiopsis fici W106-1]ETS85086.1 Quinate dehydrogenase [Pestalotiopsis fici W106-1]